MIKLLLPLAAALALAPATPVLAQASAAVAAGRVAASPLSPNEIVAAAPKAEWTAIAASDLLVMDLAPDPGAGTGAGAQAKPRRVVIQLMPAPFSQGWIGNIRKLAAAHWWDGLSVNRVQDNYVAQWGDPDGDDKAKARALPAGLAVMAESDYTVPLQPHLYEFAAIDIQVMAADAEKSADDKAVDFYKSFDEQQRGTHPDPYAEFTSPWRGFPIASSSAQVWPVHCYGMVGVGRDLSPNTGSGAELYTVIGHAPRHLDRNIALVGRVIEGIENLSSLPRGHGALGFYDLKQGDERVPILSLRLGNEVAGLPAYEYLSTESATFARYADARANRRDPFFIRPAGGADICNVPVPVRRVK